MKIKPGDIFEFRSVWWALMSKDVLYCICSEKKFNLKKLYFEYTFYDITSNKMYLLRREFTDIITRSVHFYDKENNDIYSAIKIF